MCTVILGPQLYLRPGASTSSTSAVPLITSTPVNSSDLTAGAGQPGPSAPPARPQPPVLEEDMRRIRLLIERDLIEIVVKETGSRFTTDEAQKVCEIPASLMRRIRSCPPFIFLSATGFTVLLQFSLLILIHHARFRILICMSACVL